MSQENEGPIKGFPANAAIASFLRVKLSAGYLAASGASDEDIGTVIEDVFVGGIFPLIVSAPVRMKNGTGTRKMVAAGAFAVGAVLYQAAGGKVDDTGTKRVGLAVEAATADGDVVEVLTDYAQADASVSGVVAGLAVASGQVTLDGSNPTPIATGLATVTSATFVQVIGTTPGDDPTHFTYTATAGAISLFAWKNNGTDPTLVASTDAAAVIAWTAFGTK